MKIKKITYNELNFTPVAERRVKVSSDLDVKIYTDEGVLHYVIGKDFYTDFRSGGKLVDMVIPWMSTPLYTLAVLVHDANYQSHALSFELSNELFGLMLDYAGIKRWRRKVAVAGVSAFGRSSYEEADMYDKLNAGKIKFRWSNK